MTTTPITKEHLAMLREERTRSSAAVTANLSVEDFDGIMAYIDILEKDLDATTQVHIMVIEGYIKYAKSLLDERTSWRVNALNELLHQIDYFMSALHEEEDKELRAKIAKIQESLTKLPKGSLS